MDNEELFVGCECFSPDHTARFVYWPGDGELYLTLHLVRGSFWSRVKQAFRFVFAKKPCRYGDYDEFIMKPEDVARLQEYLSNYVDTLHVEKDGEKHMTKILYKRWESRVKKILKEQD